MVVAIFSLFRSSPRRNACTWLESTIAREGSIASALWGRSRETPHGCSSKFPSERRGGRVECSRTDVVGIFPDRPSMIRLVGAILAEQHGEWAVARRHMSEESLKKARRSAAEPGPDRPSWPPPARSWCRWPHT
jgi:hypothetical protein